ncbi:MAG: MFS transporter, partial [Vicinamibacteria bacterium]
MERKSRLRFAVFALAGTAFFLSFFHRVAPAALSQDLMREFRLSSAALGTLSATYFLRLRDDAASDRCPRGHARTAEGAHRGGSRLRGGSLLMG